METTNKPPSEANVKLREAAFTRVEDVLGISDPKRLPSTYSKYDQRDSYRRGLEWGKLLLDDGIKYQHSTFEFANHHFELMNSSPYGLHDVMFVPTLEHQCTDLQKEYWLPLAKSGNIVGVYCQTELGHGTFLRGIETTATLDLQTDEWVVNSPTISSTKFWPGGLGYSATHAIVMARVVVGGRDYGPHLFVMQLRSVENHQVLPGIELGDIGLKLGFNETDNGFARFDHVRIPRENMLMKNVEVKKDGSYLNKLEPPKPFYFTMTRLRMNIVRVVAFQLAQAVTIATRYSVVREQGVGQETISHTPEYCIMSYKSQHARLLARMAQAFAIHFASKSCAAVFEDTMALQHGGDMTQIPFNHATIAGLKAYATEMALDGAEDARRCCGGHGYSLMSGLPSIVTALLPMVTLEGENYVMYQQTARFLVKRAADIRVGKPVNLKIAYLSDGHSCRSISPCSAQDADFLLPEVQLSIFRHRAVRLTFHAEKLIRVAQREQGLTYAGAWNRYMIDLIAAAQAHVGFYVLDSFMEQIALLRDDASTLNVLRSLCSLFALSNISSPNSPGACGFIEDGHITFHQLQTIREHVDTLHATLLPDAIALTDSWGFSDASLRSALGMKDGNAYETLLNWARQSPLNVEAAKTQGVFQHGRDNFVKPTVKAML